MENSTDYYHQLIRTIHCESNKELIIKISEIINPFNEAIAAYFYNTMLGHARAAQLLFPHYELLFMKVHEKIRFMRQSKNWSQDEMAEKIRHVGHWLREN